MADSPAIEVRDLTKTYRTPLRRKKVEALRGVTFSVERGQIFGFVGPNGAGKTTTIRTLMGLIKPTSGSAKILGYEIPSREARARLGFLPETPYFYDYLTVGELLDLAGRLFGLPADLRKKRANQLIDKVGLGRARSQSLKKFSKGMLQRAGLAQALMNDPQLVVLDEPMSGLDPIGRKEVRDLILELREQGKTVFFSSHILTDIEAIADEVAIIARGALQSQGTPAELIRRTVLGIDVSVRIAADAEIGALADGATRVRRVGDELSLTLPANADVDAWLVAARDKGAKIVAVSPRHETLEELFMREIASADSSSAATEGRV
ncbi:MAG: ABC transporter ATP-binding protein [Kofleriaceae bacterium]|nr:ABC transporter ATP-binding protein [Kofleriaceae bacterium]